MTNPPFGSHYPSQPPGQPRRNPNTVVAMVGLIALAVLLGLGAGTYFLLRDDTGLANVCSLIPEKTLSEATGSDNVESEEIDPVKMPDAKGAQYGCEYSAASEQRPSTAFVLTIFASEVCKGEECLDHPMFRSGQSVKGLGDAAVRNWSQEYGTHVITAAKNIRGHTVTVSARGPGPKATEEQTVRLIDRIFIDVSQKDDLLNPGSILSQSGPGDTIAA